MYFSQTQSPCCFVVYSPFLYIVSIVYSVDFCALMHAKSLENVNSLNSSALKVNDCISASIDLSKTSYFMASNRSVFVFFSIFYGDN